MPEQSSSSLARFTGAITALNPVLLLVVGYFLNTGIQQANHEINLAKAKLEENSAQIANLKTIAETSSITLQQRVDKVKVLNDFLNDLTGTNERRRELAIEAIFIALPDEASRLVKVIEKFAASGGAGGTQIAAVAKDALVGVRAQLVADMFSSSKTTRIETLTTLRRGWSDDAAILDLLLTRAMEDVQARQADGFRKPVNDLDPAQQQIASLFNTVTFVSTIRVPTDAALRGRVAAFLKAVQPSSADAKSLAAASLRRFE